MLSSEEKNPANRFGRDAAWLQPLPEGGRAYVDRPLPFLVLNRYSTNDIAGLARRVATISPSNIVWPVGELADTAALKTLQDLLARQRDQGQQFLVVTLYDLPLDISLDDASARLEPFRFVISASEDAPAQAAVKCLAEALGKSCIDLRSPKIEHVDHAAEEPAFSDALDEMQGLSRVTLGLPQIHRVRGEPDRVYPQIRDEVETTTFDAVLQACAAFVNDSMPGKHRHYRAFGRSRMVEAALAIDQALATISRSFDFLLGVSPINSGQAFEQFRASKCSKPPTFHYRPLTISPEQAKRALYDIDVHAAEDPVLESLFNEKRRELDLQLMMLQNRNTAEFRYSSLVQYGPVESTLLDMAQLILKHVEPGSMPPADCTRVDCHAVKAAATSLIADYKRQFPGFEAEVCLREDIGMGLMVSGQSLLVSTATRVPRSRLDPLLQHEVSVHVLTAV
ncbi:MAG: tyrosine/phenylalanine carboxypeptidase domain-containing protein, partial [Thermomonas sp.]